MTRSIHVVLMSLLSAGVLMFCAPKPASAAAYVQCAKAVTDANNMIELIGSLPEAEATATLDALNKDRVRQGGAVHCSGRSQER